MLQKKRAGVISWMYFHSKYAFVSLVVLGGQGEHFRSMKGRCEPESSILSLPVGVIADRR